MNVNIIALIDTYLGCISVYVRGSVYFLFIVSSL